MERWFSAGHMNEQKKVCSHNAHIGHVWCEPTAYTLMTTILIMEQHAEEYSVHK